MSSPQYITYISSEGDRWDLLAWNYYGDPTLFGPMLMANPGLTIEPVLAAGLTVIIPVLQRAAVVTTDLPPWKSATS